MTDKARAQTTPEGSPEQQPSGDDPYTQGLEIILRADAGPVEWRQAVALFKQALTDYRVHGGDPISEALALTNIALGYFLIDDEQSASEYGREAYFMFWDLKEQLPNLIRSDPGIVFKAQRSLEYSNQVWLTLKKRGFPPSGLEFLEQQAAKSTKAIIDKLIEAPDAPPPVVLLSDYTTTTEPGREPIAAEHSKTLKHLEAKALEAPQPIEPLDAPQSDELPSGDTQEQGRMPRPDVKPVIKRAKRAKRENTARVAPKKRDRRGYIQPNRTGTKLLGVHLPGEMVDAFSVYAQAKGTTEKALLENFIAECIKEVLPRNNREKLFKQEVARSAKKFGLQDDHPEP